MASNKRPSVKKASAKAKPAAKKPAPKAKAAAPARTKVAAPPAKIVPRHPRGKLAESHGSKAALAKAIAPLVARGDEDVDALEVRLKKASNAQLLRLQRASLAVKDRFGTRDKLIEAIGAAQKKSKDKDYLAKLATFSLPELLDLAPARA
jgi:hypothetical protein